VNAEGREGALGYEVNAEGREGALGHELVKWDRNRHSLLRASKAEIVYMIRDKKRGEQDA